VHGLRGHGWGNWATQRIQEQAGMNAKLHKNACTMSAVRAKIATSTERFYVLAKRYGVTEATVYKWRALQSFEGSPTPPTHCRPRSQRRKRPSWWG